MNEGQHMKHVGFELKDFLKGPPRAELLPGVARWLHCSVSELHCRGVGCAAWRFFRRARGFCLGMRGPGTSKRVSGCAKRVCD